jgi:hypothetical protein
MKTTTQALNEFLGKKLVAHAFDESSDRHYLFFEGMSAVSVEMVVPVENPKGVLRVLVDEKFEDAQRIIDLKKLLDSDFEGIDARGT